MSDTKHTPGPWTTNVSNIIGADRTVVAYRVNRPTGGNRAVEDANAALVAAAPELLAACMDAATYLEEISDAISPGSREDLLLFALQEVIRKANPA